MTADRAKIGRTSRRRGADAERSVVKHLQALGYPDARRYLSGDGRQPGDIDGVPGLVVEVKDCKKSAWPTWTRQAAEEAGGREWVVVRRTRGVKDVGAWQARWMLDGVQVGGSFQSFMRLWED